MLLELRMALRAKIAERKRAQEAAKAAAANPAAAAAAPGAAAAGTAAADTPAADTPAAAPTARTGASAPAPAPAAAKSGLARDVKQGFLNRTGGALYPKGSSESAPTGWRKVKRRNANP